MSIVRQKKCIILLNNFTQFTLSIPSCLFSTKLEVTYLFFNDKNANFIQRQNMSNYGNFTNKLSVLTVKNIF